MTPPRLPPTHHHHHHQTKLQQTMLEQLQSFKSKLADVEDENRGLRQSIVAFNRGQSGTLASSKVRACLFHGLHPGQAGSIYPYPKSSLLCP